MSALIFAALSFQVAAVDEPKLHLWETGVMRITRHPQSFGQALWCLAHTLWIGSTFMVATTGKHLVMAKLHGTVAWHVPKIVCIRCTAALASRLWHACLRVGWCCSSHETAQ